MSLRPVGAEFWTEPIYPHNTTSSYMTRHLWRVVGHGSVVDFPGGKPRPSERVEVARTQYALITGMRFDGSPIYGEWQDEKRPGDF